jgi:DNA-binding NarL/FixJ family response regulator
LIAVLIQASSGIARAGFESLLKESDRFQIVGDREDADVVLTDLPPEDLPGELPVVLLVSDSFAAAEALRSGIRAALPSDATSSQIFAAIEAAAAGLVVMHPEDVDAVLGHRSLPPGEPLTSRETEVLRMLAEGLANKTIAHRLGISEHTVKFHVTSIMAKMNAASRTEAVTLGVRQGLILL